jgi:hypothetical protein
LDCPEWPEQAPFQRLQLGFSKRLGLGGGSFRRGSLFLLGKGQLELSRAQKQQDE